MLEQYEDVLSITELREILAVERIFTYSLMKSGTIPSIWVGRSRREWYREMLACRFVFIYPY